MLDAKKIQEHIAAAAISEAELPADVARDVAFHMTDWIGELEKLVAFCQSPESFRAEQINNILLAFLLHAPNHLAAAAKLYADVAVSDVFGVGAVRPKSSSEA